MGDAVAWLLAVRPQLDYRAAVTYAAQLAGLPLAETVAWPSERPLAQTSGRRRVIRLEVSLAR